MFNYAFIATFSLLLFLVIEYLTGPEFGKLPRILTYSSKNYILMLVCALFNAFGMNLLTIARQSYKLSFVMIISYATLIYSFIADLTVFHLDFSG